MTTGGIHLFQLLKDKMGDREAGALIDYVDTSLKENKRDIQETNLRTLVTKEDLAKTKEELKGDIVKTREDLKADLAKTKEELKGDIAKTREELKGDIAKLDVKIGNVNSGTIRWMFAFFVTMMLTILGLYLKH
jgi:predicted  nucleic acid-binding Zn-ribbon protein